MSRMGTFPTDFVLVVSAMGLLVTGCTSPQTLPTREQASTFPASGQPASSASGASTQGAGTPQIVDHVVIILEENHSAKAIMGNADAPYINKLAADYTAATNYKAVAHPSLPNYLALTSGTTAGITSDCNPGAGCTVKGSNIADSIEKSGRTWKMYAESMPAPCTKTNVGLYAVRHNPFMYYPSVTNDQTSCAAHVVPLTQLAQDLAGSSSLPNLVVISPNLCNDMHDCSVATGDAWLAKLVPAILASPAFTTQNSLLALTWDEDDNKSSNMVTTIFAGTAAQQNRRSTLPYSHYSLLHTVESLWALDPLTDNDKNAPIMTDMLR